MSLDTQMMEFDGLLGVEQEKMKKEEERKTFSQQHKRMRVKKREEARSKRKG